MYALDLIRPLLCCLPRPIQTRLPVGQWRLPELRSAGPACSLPYWRWAQQGNNGWFCLLPLLPGSAGLGIGGLFGFPPSLPVHMRSRLKLLRPIPLSTCAQLLRLFAGLIRAQHLGKRNPHSSFYLKLAEDFQSPAVGGMGQIGACSLPARGMSVFFILLVCMNDTKRV